MIFIYILLFPNRDYSFKKHGTIFNEFIYLPKWLKKKIFKRLYFKNFKYNFYDVYKNVSQN